MKERLSDEDIKSKKTDEKIEISELSTRIERMFKIESVSTSMLSCHRT